LWPQHGPNPPVRQQAIFATPPREQIGNEWATVNEIGDGAKIGWGSVRQVLYKTNKKDFESRDHPEGGRKKQFRLLQPDQQ